MPSFTAKDMERFRSARGRSIWIRRGEVSANEDALVIMRYHIIEECREQIKKEIKSAEEANARATKNGCIDDAIISAAIAAKLSAISSSLQDLIDMDSYRKLKSY